ncbi:MAG: UDP-N-acetylmuramoyl-tripeptide--D-alanyl-D-alanine ligase [Candidatus Choladocola sp.]|nr:UDP-N-acetylmuramoyl-tripeptide--D-alanyl-D-alanine ligase [Candidatus Choladocola sp.]
MKGLTLSRIAEVCGGTYSGREEDREREVCDITTDSRKAGGGSLFAAIRGERADGHDFIPSVFEKGALCAISEKELPDAAGNYIRVSSTLDALKAIAQEYLEQLQIPVVGITGSVGKTSTKEMIAAVLAQKYRVLKTAGNFNNELGLPLTVFRLREEDEIAVLEMGISHFGEMHRLAKIAKPDTCVITNIGQCHLEFLGDRDGVLRAKSEIFDFLRPDGHIVLNGDDDKLETIREVKGIRPVFFGIDSENDVYADRIEKKGLDGISCRIHTKNGSFTTLIPIPGIHMVFNALAGTAVGLHYGLTLEQIRKGIESLQPVSGRFHILHTEKYTIIDDCYNANPVSMKASLEVLQDGLGRKVAILGDMGELGADEALLHRQVGEFAGELDLDRCICVGPLCGNLAEGIESVNPEMDVTVLPNLQELLKQIPQLVQADDTILVKASHFMHFEKVVEMLSLM